MATFTTEQLTQRWEDQRALKNLMGKYANCLILNREQDIFDLFWTSGDDICLSFNDGAYVGTEAVEAYYAACCERNKLVARLLQKRFPEQLGGKSEDEIYGVGPFKAEPLTSFYMQEAEDGETAKAIWMVEGSITDITEKGPVTNWSWGYYCADFVREDGHMKLWHVLRVEDVHCPNGVDWGMPENNFPELPEFSELKEIKLPEPTVKETVYETYSASRGPAKPPRVPEPYKTFAETFSYGV